MKKIMKKKILIPSAIVLIVIIIVAFLVGGNSKDNTSNTMVTSEKVKKRDIKEVLDTSGTVESEKKMTYYSPVNAPIKEMKYNVGDVVNAGDTLVAFNLDSLERDNQKSELNVRSGQLSYEDTVTQANKAADTVAQARSSAESLLNEVHKKQDEVDQLNNKLSQTKQNAQATAQANQETVLKDYQSKLATAQQQMVDAEKTKSTITQQYNEAVTKWEIARTNKDNNAAAYETNMKEIGNKKVEAESAYTTAKSSLESLQNSQPDMVTGDVDTTQLEASLSQAQNELAALQSEQASAKAAADGDANTITDAAKQQLQTTTNLAELEKKSVEEMIKAGKEGIIAPFKGVISDKQVETGALAAQGLQLISIESIQDACVNVSISKNDFEKVKEGQKAEITLAGNKYQGTVKKISRIAIANDKGTPMINAQVSIDNPNENIYLGVDAKVKIMCNEVKDTKSVSAIAVNVSKDGSFCYVIKNGKLEKQIVEKGAVSNQYIEIKEGLKEGDKVVTDPGDFKEGDIVEKEGR